MTNSNTVIVCTAGVGFIIFVAGISLGWYGFPAIIVQEVKQSVILVKGTEAYERWRKLPVPLSFNIYLFNVTNPEEVQNGANPVVQEIGPYVYDEYREKFDVTDHADGTLSYVQNSTFYFNKEKSGNLSEDDVVTVLNIALLGTVSKAQRYISPGMPLDDVLSEAFQGSEKVYHTATVGDLAWRGVNVINCTVPDQMSSEGRMVCGALPSLLPAMVAEHEPGIYKMAYFRHKNNTSDGRYRINSGISNVRNLGRIEEWNGMPNLTFWSDTFCNTIGGTDGTIFPPFWSPKDKVYIYLVDICRSLYAEFESENTWKGLPALRYVGGVHNFEDAKDYPPNICFCEDTGEDEPECLKSGVLDLYQCLGVSAIFSLPHFYNASPDYQLYVQGLNPNKEKHETFLDIEPEIGLAVRGYKRMQMNIFLKKTSDLTALSKVSEGLFPVFWAEEGCELDEKELKPVRRLYTLICVFAVVKWFLLVGGVVLMCVSIYMFAFRRKSDHKLRPNEDKSRNDVFYDNKAYASQHMDINDGLSISTLSDITRIDHADIRKRWGNFPDKSSTSFETNKTSDNVGLGVFKEPNKNVTLSNVFM